MLQASAPGRAPIAIVIRALAVFDAIALLFAGIVHLVGARIPLGNAVFAEPAILPAGIVEGLAGVIFVVALFAIFTRARWAWGATLTAHLFAIAGFVVGLVATRAGTTPFNYDYHRVMLAVFIVGLILLALPAGRATLRYSKQSA